MQQVTEAAARQALESYTDPALATTLGEAGAVRAVSVSDRTVDAEVVLGFPVGGYGPELRRGLEAQLRQAGLDATLSLSLSASIPSSVANRSLQPLPGVANVIAVASGKGGVGKSTVTANLVIGLAQQGARVGVLDADIYGPSQPRMMGLSGQRPTTHDGKRMEPPANYGVKVMSIGFMIEEQTPMVWRGPMVTQALVQLLNETNWGDLDYLIVDMPPGTGDTQLTLAQRVPVSGAVIVTTPQDIALLDARKGLMMFRKVEIPVLGVVENMSVHVCPACGHESHVFGAGGGRSMAEQYGVALLGELPLELSIREQADAGCPTVVAEPDSAVAQAYGRVARKAAAQLALAAGASAASAPRITVEDDE